MRKVFAIHILTFAATSAALVPVSASAQIKGGAPQAQAQAQAQQYAHCHYYCEPIVDQNWNQMGWGCATNIYSSTDRPQGEQCGATVDWCIIFQGNICLGDPPPLALSADGGLAILGMRPHCGLGTNRWPSLNDGSQELLEREHGVAWRVTE